LPDRLGKLDAATCASALLVAIEQKQIELTDRLIAQLAKVDETGQSVSDTLQRLTTEGRDSEVEQLATRLLVPTAELEITPAAREAACRWAGRKQHWAMLALASEASDVNVKESSRTVAVERLFAEALTQVGRGEEAQVWWNHLVDSRGATDFATLLRCAETATTYADVPTATNRISDAKSAAGVAADRVSLVQMLSAELAVRELKFDEARSILHAVIRSDGAVTSLRGRAQWVIGETYYMQEKFADAIEAYRKVEGIDPDGNWVAIALVQAGKSFEQLGRTREAAVCYSTLVSRFAESPHAVAARRRLAAIDPTSAPSSTTETIRR
jgi:tetratricopeptide (TPR) repeat protein